MSQPNFLIRVLALVAFSIASLAASAAIAPELACSNSSTLFCSGFEEGSFSVWDDWDDNSSPTNVLMSDPGPFNKSGNTSARLKVPAGRGGADVVKMLPSTYDKVYVRWYQKWEPGHDFSAPNHGGGLHAGDRNLAGHSHYRPTGSDWYSAWLEPEVNGRLNLYVYYRGMYMDCADPNGQCWGDHFPCFVGDSYCTKAVHRPTIMPPVMQTNRWYCLEMMMDGGTPSSDGSNAGGALNYWIDDVQYGPWTNLWFRTNSNLKVSQLTLGQFFPGTHADAGIMIDNVVISRDHVGCGAAPGTVPNPPTNVRAN